MVVLTIDDAKYHTLWQRLKARLAAWEVNWEDEIAKTAVTDKLQLRQRGTAFSDEEVFEALLLSILSNNTGWEKIRLLKSDLADRFYGFDVEAYAKCSEDEVSRIVDWFKSRRSASLTLAQDLRRLRLTAKTLAQFRDQNGGGTEGFFLQALSAANGNIVDLPLLLARRGEWKLPGFGVALCAEALRNLGFNLAKPDRHILRAVGSWSLVKFVKWPDRDGRKAPIASELELRQTMLAVQRLASVVGEETTFVDSTIWTACAKSGAWLENSELSAMDGT